jgi:hypothetical protein
LLKIYEFQAPNCWSELPEKIWLQVFQNLKVKDLNNVHLVCRNFHQIANLVATPILHLHEKSLKHPETLIQSSRIFEELKFGYDYDDYSHREKIEEFVRLRGRHIKRLVIDVVDFNPLKVLNWFPKLKIF